jgi:NitT/TauT family transport system ATP-binding protein
MGGIVKPDAGTIEGFPQEKKSYIFQETRILPWKTVHQNIVFPLLDLMPRKEAMDHARSFMSMVGLEKEEHLYPSQLSGGMKQRVSIARAFAYPGTLILMDEAFQNLDSYLKYNILNSFRKIWEMDRRTVIFVTHDIDEALFLGQKIVILGGAPLSTIRIIDNEGSDQQNIKSTILNFLNLP